jgi:hypothetical protein
MTTDDRSPHPKDVPPPKEGVIHPAQTVDAIADDSPTEGADPIRNPGEEILDKRPTDGPI